MWHRVAQRSWPTTTFLVMPDLRGYGDSSQNRPACPTTATTASATVAADMVGVMDALGASTVSTCAGTIAAGAWRTGWRWTTRNACKKLCVLDIAPTLDMYEGRHDRALWRSRSAYYHWFHLLQPAPLPETMMGANHPGDPKAVSARQARRLGQRRPGAHRAAGAGRVRAQLLQRPEAIHAACEDYRASAGIDLEHDRDSRAQRPEQVRCDMLVLWGARGAGASPVRSAGACGRPSARPRQRPGHAQRVTSSRKSSPQETADALARFLQLNSFN
jgi:haloacetate dehalogenase